MRTATAVALGVSLAGFAGSVYFQTADGVIAFAAASIFCWIILDS